MSYVSFIVVARNVIEDANVEGRCQLCGLAVAFELSIVLWPKELTVGVIVGLLCHDYDVTELGSWLLGSHWRFSLVVVREGMHDVSFVVIDAHGMLRCPKVSCVDFGAHGVSCVDSVEAELSVLLKLCRESLMGLLLLTGVAVE